MAELERARLTTNEPQAEPPVVISAVMRAAAREARGRPLNQTRAREVTLAARALVKIAARLLPHWKGQRVTTRFPGDAEIATRASPLTSMRCDPPTASAKMREQMRQLVAQRAIDFRFAMRAQLRIEEDARGAIFGPTGGGAQARRPFHLYARGERRGIVLPQQITCPDFKGGIAA